MYRANKRPTFATYVGISKDGVIIQIPTPIPKISLKFIRNFLSNPTDKQTTSKQTKKQTEAKTQPPWRR